MYRDLGSFGGYFDTMVMWQFFFGRTSKFRGMFEVTWLFKSTRLDPMADFFAGKRSALKSNCAVAPLAVAAGSSVGRSGPETR